MEKDEEVTLPSTSSVGSVTINEGVAAAAGNATTTTREEVPAIRKVYATAEQIQSVFSTRRITHTIMPHLSFGDLKAARQVSRTFLEMVEAFKPFKEAQVLCITDKKCSTREVNLVLNSGRHWRGIKIDSYALQRQSWNIPRHILENVHFLSIVSSEGHTSKEEEAPPVHSFLEVLKSTRNVSHLQLDLCVLPEDFQDVIDCSDVRENLKDLKHLDIVSTDDRYRELDLREALSKSRYSFAESFLQLAKSGILQRLECLHTPNVSFSYVLHKSRFQTGVLELLQQNRETLKELSIHMDIWEVDDEIGPVSAVTLPNLRMLTSTVPSDEQGTFLDFLANHPSLEELSVSIKDIFLRSLFDEIKQRSANLRKLHLSLQEFGDFCDFYGADRTVDWTFLGEMTELKDFQLYRSFCKDPNWEMFGNGTRLLECLPRNQLERLTLRGIGAGTRDCGFWKRKERYVPRPWEKWQKPKRRRQSKFVDVEPGLSMKLHLLGGFRQLKRLSFRRCPDVVDDYIMEFICKELTSLEDFEVSHCSDLTDAGIVGELKDGSDSIRNLKVLKHLSIRSCPMVTPKGLLSCLRLPSLQSLDYLAPTSVSKSFVLGIMSQNPSLESIAVNFGCLRKEVLNRASTNGRRLKTLIHLKGTEEVEELDTSKEVVNERKTFASEEQVRAVFSNRLIAHTILSHLNFADMKAARQVSETFLDMIETSKRFKDAQVLRLAKGKCPFGELNFLLQNSERIWRGIRIDVPVWPENLLLNHVSGGALENIEFVSLRIDNSIDSKYFDMKAFECIMSFIRDILSSIRNIKHLQIGAKLFDMNLRSVFECSDVQGNLKALQRLDITDSDNNTGINSGKSYFSFWSTFSEKSPVHVVTNCWTDNFLLLGTILRRLQSFGIADRSLLGGYRHDRDDKLTVLQSAIVGFLEANRETLKELSIHSEAWYDNNGVSGATFPRLKSLTAVVSTYVSASDRLKDFLANHPTLEELDVAVEVAFVTSLLDVIIERSANLRKLHLNAKKFFKSFSVSGRTREVKVDWTFLGEMTRLKDFALVRPFCRNANWEKYGTGKRILECLPQNQLERLSLKGIGARKYAFWIIKGYKGRYIDLELSSKLEILRGFQNLKRLSLRRCPDAVDDDIMKFIVKEMTSLEEFEVSHCSELTDAGIVGTSGDGSDSIRNLKGLKGLSIAYCPLVTPDGLLSCLRLQFLRHFEYVASVKVRKDFVLKIMSRNPSLESVSVNLDCHESEVLEEVKNPRLTKVTNLTGTDEDSDSDADTDDDSSDEENVSSESEDGSDFEADTDDDDEDEGSDEENVSSDSEDDSDNIDDGFSESD